MPRLRHVPDEGVGELERFLLNVRDTYRLIAVDGRVRPSERKLLLQLIDDASSSQPDRLVADYRDLPANAARDAGIDPVQLRIKVAISIAYSEGLQEGKSKVATKRARRWIKRAKTVLGSLKSLIPGAEVFLEALDFLDASLDR